MREVFHDLPEALENAVEIARRCNLELEFGSYFLPGLSHTRGTVGRATILREVSTQGLEDLLNDPGHGRVVHGKGLSRTAGARELEVIESAWAFRATS